MPIATASITTATIRPMKAMLVSTSCFLPGACAAGNAGVRAVQPALKHHVRQAHRLQTQIATALTTIASKQSDEDYVSQPTSCGVGACAARAAPPASMGRAGQLHTWYAFKRCKLATALTTTATIRLMRAMSAQSTNCGVGACAATGSTSCVAGGVVDSCTPGTPSSDANCDGIDNDCSGTADEDYVSQPTSCGVGACAATGSTSCVAGGEVDSCTPGSSTAEVCNGIDDDCNGEIDDGLTFKTYYHGCR